MVISRSVLGDEDGTGVGGTGELNDESANSSESLGSPEVSCPLSLVNAIRLLICKLVFD
jgi:hypothetical protein